MAHRILPRHQNAGSENPAILTLTNVFLAASQEFMEMNWSNWNDAHMVERYVPKRR
jgi:ribose 1,5-bisphosphokinase PhnN